MTKPQSANTQACTVRLTAAVADLPRRRRRAGFTLVELLVVIGLIVLLIGLLLPALANVRKSARVTQSTNLMKNLGDASDSFFLALQRYPGVLSERQLCGDSSNYEELSGTENAMIDLMGGLEERGNDVFDLGDINDIYRQSIGRGPKIDGVQHAAFFQPSPEDLYYVNGQIGQDRVDNNSPDVGANAFPDLVDAFGTPIIFWRHSGEKSNLRERNGEKPIVAMESQPGNEDAAPYYAASFQSYTDSDALGINKGRSAINMQTDSLLSQTGSGMRDVLTLSQRITAHPSMPGVARGRYVIMSAGPDQTYFAKDTVEGTNINLDDPDILERFDDTVLYGGG